MVDMINVRALMTKQDKNTKLYSFFLNGKDVSKVADISRIELSLNFFNLIRNRSGKVI